MLRPGAALRRLLYLMRAIDAMELLRLRPRRPRRALPTVTPDYGERKMCAKTRLSDAKYGDRPLNCRARMFGIVRHWNNPSKNQGFALDPGDKDGKIQGVSVRATRKPQSLFR